MTRLPMLAAVLMALVLPGPAAQAADATPPPWKGKSVLDDPEWQKRFLGSYGFLSGAEPQVGAGELEVLREVIALMRANPRAAAAVLQQKVGADSSAALDFVLANLEFQNGQLESAAKHYESALAKFPDFRRAHKNLGLLRVQSQQYDAALEHLTRAVELGDRDGRSYGLLGFLYVNRESYVAAEKAYGNAVLQEPDVRDWKLGLARSLLAMERHREAVALFQSLIQEDPGDTTAWMLQANAYIGLGESMQAATNLEAVRLLGEAQPRSLVLLGDIYMNGGMLDLARSAYVEAIGRDEAGTEFETAYRAADLLLRAQAWSEADEVLRLIAKRYPKLPDGDDLRVLTLRAKLARAQGRKQEAAELLEKVVARDGTRGDALLELAAYHRDRGDTARALLLIERAEKLEAYEHPALLEHAQVMVGERDYTKAAELLRRALQIRHEPRVERFLSQVERAMRPS